MSVRGNSENCVEEPVAPEWLSKLESRRENLQRATKLSHEVGAGAPCGECGDKCPGLDLHFWRKVCRNCKCRKDQHKCVDDDLSSWAQFEILGQICSKPAFIKIKALASQPVQLDWVPPNTTPDVVSDYMEKLGATKMPIVGSDAAQKRKQQLEFQVPPHDLNAALCDNLTDAEAAQLQQYVVKIRENCVGQGVVVRIGNMGIGFVEYIAPQQQQQQQHHQQLQQLNMLMTSEAYNMPTKNMQPTPFNATLCGDANELSFHSPLPVKNAVNARFSAQMRQETPARKLKFGTICNLANTCGLPVNVDYDKDAVFAQILHAEPLKKAIENKGKGLNAMPVVISQTQMLPDFMSASILSPTTKQKLKDIGVNVKTVQSALLNSPFYDALYDTLKHNDIDYDECRVLAPIQALREEVLVNRPLAEELSSFVSQLPNSAAIMYTSPPENSLVKSGGLSGSSSNDSGFGSKASTPVGGADMLTAGGLPNAFQQMRLGSNVVKDFPPPPPVVNCRDCAKPIPLGDVAVKAERAGKEIAWHPECFKCYTCRELLADLVYFFHGGQVYCGRDLAINLKIPRCKACDELIFTKEYTAAEGATFHIKHFCCYHCDTPLAGQQYIPDEKTNMPICLKCYNEFFAATCQRCNRQIEPTDQGVAWGDVHWHSGCFVCAGVDCDKSLIGGRFCVKQKMPFCSAQCVRSII
ncbi:unnamed protein product [Ceratitis capitata]|uniref:(Mediterranean fruit fly) hypothetical protein n=1 Tax=Ceratitis capitata TaxID=7213 RepID=A0A811V811_CERCA|nr:unnamed protein product [Ceratitis capitata]